MADSEAKRVAKAKFSCFSGGPDSVSRRAHADKITVCPEQELGGFGHHSQQFAVAEIDAGLR